MASCSARVLLTGVKRSSAPRIIRVGAGKVAARWSAGPSAGHAPCSDVPTGARLRGRTISRDERAARGQGAWGRAAEAPGTARGQPWGQQGRLQ